MGKIFIYECKRLLCNKFFFGILLILLFYGRQVLNDITIMGVSHTAPFSAWSFGDYLSRMIPVLWIATLLFLTFFTSPAARRVSVLTDAAPMPPRRYEAVRCCAALAASVLTALVCIAEAAVFYGVYFGRCDIGSLTAPALVTALPAIMFALGSGRFLGQINERLIYIWMAAPLAAAALPLPGVMGIWNESFFTEYPLLTGSAEPAFAVPAGIAAVQCAFLVCGAVMSVCRFGKK